MRARIEEDDKVILNNIQISLTEPFINPQSGLKSWSGAFFDHQHEIDCGNYRLVLEDGRSGNIVITSISDDGVYFLGSGPLA